MYMDMTNYDTSRTPHPRRRRRSKMQIFKEAYLPSIILAVTVVMILVFIIGAAVRQDAPDDGQLSGTDGNGSTPTGTNLQTQPSDSAALRLEAELCLEEAERLAADYDYDGAIAVLEGFSGDIADFLPLQEAYQRYISVKENMVAWKAERVYNLSVDMLIADPVRAFADSKYGSTYKKDMLTTTEFAAILQQLYDNGYVLVRLQDFYAEEFNSTTGRYVFREHELLLPAGKKPIMLTETNANYYTYMTDSDGDGMPDAGGDGFASRLCFDGKRFYNERIHADGAVSTGSYDVVPLLEDFISEHPDFSYKGARAILAFTGYDGVLGYRIQSNKLDDTALQQERAGAIAIVEALQAAGYDLAFGGFNNINYATSTATQVRTDIQNWLDQVKPYIGNLNILVFPQGGDIAGDENYSGNSKYNLLYSAGLKFYLGQADTPWNQVDNQYVRHSCLRLSGQNLQSKPELYAELFDPAAVKDSARGA